MKAYELIEWLNEHHPQKFAEDWDNVGLLVGDDQKEISHVFLALDLTEPVLDEAVASGADMILTHHPMIFSGIKKINNHTFTGRKILRLIKEDIPYFAMHTNFDAAPGCMADLAAKRLDIQDGQPLEVTGEVNGIPVGIGKAGRLAEPVSPAALAELVKQVFELPFVLVYGEKAVGEKVSRVAVSPGAGGSMIRYALQQKAEILVTGDIGHHDAIDAAAQGMAVIDAGHYGLEHIFVPFMAEYVARVSDGTIEVIQAEPDFPARVL